MQRLFAFILVIFVASATSSAFAQNTSAIPAVQLAGEQRMLSQRMAKLYSQIGLNIVPSVAVNQLMLVTGRFESNLAALQPTAASSAAASKAYERLNQEWQAMKRALDAAISREAAEALAHQSDATLAAAEHLTQVLEDESQSAAARLVNQAGRQRMLSQRIANNYLLRSWGNESSATRETLAAASSDFSAGLKKLQARQDNSPEIQSKLEEVAQQWEWLQASLSVEGAGAYRLIVAESADAILDATDHITHLYEAQIRR